MKNFLNYYISRLFIVGLVDLFAFIVFTFFYPEQTITAGIFLIIGYVPLSLLFAHLFFTIEKGKSGLYEK